MPAIRFAFAVISIGALLAALSGSAAGAADNQPLDLRVMSFNIRFAEADGAERMHMTENR